MTKRSLQYFEERKRKLDFLIKEVKALPENQDRLKNELARYLCIRISGLIERTVTSFYEEYAQSKGHPNLSRYISKKLNLQNPSMKKLTELAGSFNEGWKKELDALDDEIKTAVDTIVNIRNHAAHGEDQSITLSKVESYYKPILKLLNVIRQQCEIDID